MDMDEKTLTDKDRRFLLDFSCMVSATSDQIESLRFERITPEYARGYLECFSKKSKNRGNRSRVCAEKGRVTTPPSIAESLFVFKEHFD